MSNQIRFRDCNVELNPIVVSISHTKYFIKPPKQEEELFILGEPEEEDELDYVVEKKDVFFSLNIKIDQVEWNIPYLVVLKKCKNELKKGYSTNYPVIKKVECENSFMYLMDRYINIPFFQIKYQKNMDILIDILLILSSKVYRQDIYKHQYDNVDPNIFFMSNDLKNLNDQERIKYCIRKYHAPTMFICESVMRFTIQPLINKTGLKTKNERILSRENDTTKEKIFIESYNLIPENYAYTYRKSFDFVYPATYSSYYIYENSSDSLGYTIYNDVFFGSYNECQEIIQDDVKFKELKKKVDENEGRAMARKAENEAFDYYHGGGAESDYFDAMTDGQLGIYDDYKGNIDDIDTWNRG